VEDGLVANPVRQFYQDANGFLWIATLEGLSKYDGYKFANFSIANGLSHNMVNSMYESPDKKLYVAENNGTVDILQHDAIIEKGAFKNIVVNRFCVLKNQRVIAATDSAGIYELVNGNLTRPVQSLQNSTYNDFRELSNSFLIGGSEGSIRIMDRDYNLVAQIEQPKEFLTYKIFRASNNKVWLGTNKGLKLLDLPAAINLKNLRLLPSPFNIPELNSGDVNDVMEDLDANLWVGTKVGLVMIRPDGTWKFFTEKDGLPSPNINCVYQDRERNIWIGTSLGIAKLATRNRIQVYTMEDGLISNNVSFLVPLGAGRYLAGTESGVQLYNPFDKHFVQLTSQADFAFPGIVKNTNPVLFFNNDNRFARYDSIKNSVHPFIPPSPPKSEVYCSIQDSNGVLFIGTHRGLLIRYLGRIWYDKKFTHRVTQMLIDKKGYLWVGTWDKGLFRIRYSPEFIRNIPGTQPGIPLTIDDFSAVLPDQSIRSIFEDRQGDIWVGTRNQGLLHLRALAGNKFQLQHFDHRNGLTSNWVRAIAQGTDRTLWIGSDLGIDKLLIEGSSYHLFNFSRVNNFFASINAIVTGAGGSVWLCTSTGLVDIMDGETEKMGPPTVAITSIRLGDTAFHYNSYQSAKATHLRYNQNQAFFEFSAPSFINEKQIFYSFRLLGSADTIWSIPSNSHTVSYASLQPGKYNFEVRTTGWNRQQSTPMNFSFIVDAPFWNKWWFYSLIAIILSFIFYKLYRYRINQITKMQNVRNRIATDLHDDIGSTLTNINMLSEISRKSLHQPGEAERFLHRISDEVTASSQALNDIIWNVNTRNDSMEETLSRMRRYAAELFDDSKTTCWLTMDEGIAEKKLNMEQRRDMYLIYKESMNNIVKHASASNVWIELQWMSGQLVFKIRDDGKGFNPDIARSSNGLRNIRSRTEKWKGTMELTARPGEGTFIEIHIPLAG
jgi:ligand-binding sensor domain-containing protein/signal transduction histidine kinase